MTQHTPGPWNKNTSDIGRIMITRPIPDWPEGFHDKIADCILERDLEQNVANANLIAAAPDLLAALKVAWEEADMPVHVRAQVSVAIAKAGGAS